MKLNTIIIIIFFKSLSDPWSIQANERIAMNFMKNVRSLAESRGCVADAILELRAGICNLFRVLAIAHLLFVKDTVDL